MALVVKDRVQETSTTTGTGTLTLGGAVSGYQTFSSAIGNTNTTYYTISNGSEWEVGLGTVGAGTLARTTILESSNGGTAVNFSAGTKNVFCTYPAEKAVIQDASGFVGIGTNTPSYNLEVYGSEPTSRVYNTNAALASMVQIANPSNYMLIGKDRDGSAGWYGNAGQYIIACNGAFPLDFYTNGTKRMSITSAGGVSFGTSATAYGTSGQVLTSNGNAAPTWTNAGVTSVAASTGISVSASTGAVTITNTSPNQLTTTTGSPAYYGARAWVNFNGEGTVAIRASVNVTSITDNSTGNYTVNFTTAMPDANYVVADSLSGGGSVVSDTMGGAYLYSTSSFTINTRQGNNTQADRSTVACAVFR